MRNLWYNSLQWRKASGIHRYWWQNPKKYPLQTECQGGQRKQEEKLKLPRDITPPGMMTHVYFRKDKKEKLFGSWFQRCQPIMIEEKQEYSSSLCVQQEEEKMRHRNGASYMPKNSSPPTSHHFPVKLSHYKSRRESIHSLGQSFYDLFAFWNLVTPEGVSIQSGRQSKLLITICRKMPTLCC